jgi:leucine dehydrogenase
MNLLSPESEHEEVVFCHDRASGLRSIIAIHNTKLGPGMGGTRFFPFASEEEALADVLRLSRAMTYKSAAAGIDFGGGKAVIIGDPRVDKTDAKLRAYAGFVDSLGGRYLTTEDVGTTEDDVVLFSSVTKYVVGLPDGSGDPSEPTSWGLFSAMRALARRLWDADSLAGRHVAIQGIGKVGSGAARHLAQDGAKLTIADVAEDAARTVAAELGADVVPPDHIHAVECDVFSPCALGGSLNARTIPELSCTAIAGCANNQLTGPEAADLIQARGIVYAPDYIVNAGGVINIAHEAGGYDKEVALAHVWRIGETVERVLDLARDAKVTTARAADMMAEERFEGRSK